MSANPTAHPQHTFASDPFCSFAVFWIRIRRLSGSGSVFRNLLKRLNKLKLLNKVCETTKRALLTLKNIFQLTHFGLIKIRYYCAVLSNQQFFKLNRCKKNYLKFQGGEAKGWIRIRI